MFRYDAPWDWYVVEAVTTPPGARARLVPEESSTISSTAFRHAEGETDSTRPMAITPGGGLALGDTLGGGVPLLVTVGSGVGCGVLETEFTNDADVDDVVVGAGDVVGVPEDDAVSDGV